MTERLFSSPREFRIWSFTVGHKELLLRSTKENSLTTRVDVLFVNVAAINLPTTLPEIDVVEADERERVARGIVLENDPSYWHDMERIRSGRSSMPERPVERAGDTVVDAWLAGAENLIDGSITEQSSAR